jgi:hypothetical protein
MTDNAQAFDPTAMIKRITRNHRPGKHDPIGEAEGVIKRPDQFDSSYHSSTVILCKDIAAILTKKWPKYQWAVKPNQAGRVIDIYNLHCHTEFAYTIRMVDIMHDPSRREAYRAGAEMLKRFNMPERFSPAAVATAPRDLKGQMIPDISDLPDTKMKRDAEIANKLATGEWSIVDTAEGRYLRKNR